MYTSNVGRSYLFMAPEKLRPRSGDRLRTGFASDVWAFGITMLQLLCCDTMAPYGRSIDLPDIIMMLMVDRQSPQVPAVPDAPELQSILQACLSLDYKERPFAAQLVQAFEGIFSHLQSTTLSTVADARAAARVQQLQLLQASNKSAVGPAVVSLRLLSCRTCTGHSSDVRSVAFTPDGTTLVSGSNDKTIKLWDVASGSCRDTLKGHTDSVRSVAVSRDGCTLASGSFDKTVRLWNLISRRCIATLSGRTPWTECVAITASVNSAAISPDGANWVESVTESVDISPNGATLASGSLDRNVWCTATLSGHTDLVYSVAICPYGTIVASGSYDKTVRLWYVLSGKHKATLQGHSAGVYCVAFSPDGTHLASGGGIGDCTVRLWDMSSASCVAILKGHTRGVSSVVFSHDGAALLSGSYDTTVQVWDARTGANKNILQGHTSFVDSVALTPDGAFAASGSGDKTIK
ncbi:WD40-repeat-containing domain protein [Dunaliella salina]|uniref:WD40-repeat-containing domain protein n=1 Tax=Dunaliella salina TaxID=3046 RepID=A0ABQ7G1U3_DUNSA|nr:WD40-repeat-containing domain protein [Dunaliella salina]|eukprot:KAF5828571.1 WD40-repeat-containing domain protein [Dunaliella salina]